jgi:hypothetical protein
LEEEEDVEETEERSGDDGKEIEERGDNTEEGKARNVIDGEEVEEEVV